MSIFYTCSDFDSQNIRIRTLISTSNFSMTFQFTILFLLSLAMAYFGIEADVNGDTPPFGVGGPFPQTPTEAIFTAMQARARTADGVMRTN